MGVEISGSTNSDINCNGSGCSATASAEGGFSTEVTNSKGYGVSFSVNGEATTTHDITSEDGVTTYTATADVSVTVEGAVNTPQAGATIAHTDGITATYQVSMPDEVATAEAMANANPFDPASMPEGTVIQVDDSHYSGNEFSVTFRGIRASSSITETEGSSMLVEKTGESTIKVTTGPTQAIAGYNGVGLDFGVGSVSLGNNSSIESATLHTAEFDLSTPRGLAAYNHFVTTGEMPTENGPGVSGVQTIEKLDASSQVVIEGSLGPFSGSLDGASSSGSSVRVTEPDGTSTVTSVITYDDNVPVTVTQSFDADGNEAIDQRTYSFEVEATEDNYQLVNTAATGDVGQAEDGPVQPGQTVTVTMTQPQMEQAIDMSEDGLDARGDLAHHSSIYGLVRDGDGNTVAPLEFALAIVRNGNDFEVAETLFTISDEADGSIDNNYEALPMTIEIKQD